MRKYLGINNKNLIRQATYKVLDQFQKKINKNKKLEKIFYMTWKTELIGLTAISEASPKERTIER